MTTRMEQAGTGQARAGRHQALPKVADPRPVALHGRRCEEIDLESAISGSGIRTGVALLASAARYVVTRVADGRLLVPDGRAGRGGLQRAETELRLAGSGVDEVFEARVFDGSAELRWLRRPGAPGGLGTASLLSEDPARLDGAFPGEPRAGAPRRAEEQGPRSLEPGRSTSSALAAVDRIDGRYVLWGTPLGGAEAPPEWTTLAEARIGLLDVPATAPASPDWRVYLHVVEYVGVDERGNAYIAEERLCDLVAEPVHSGADPTEGE